MDSIIKILEQIKPGVDFNTEENLIEDEILDSFDIVTLVAKLNDEFDVEITPVDLIPENFNTAKIVIIFQTYQISSFQLYQLYHLHLKYYIFSYNLLYLLQF